MAVALVKFLHLLLALKPINVLLTRVVFLVPAKPPRAVLYCPVGCSAMIGITHRGVFTCGVVIKRLETIGGVVAASLVGKQWHGTSACIVIGGGVVPVGAVATRGIVGACCVVVQVLQNQSRHFLMRWLPSRHPYRMRHCVCLCCLQTVHGRQRRCSLRQWC